MACRSLARAQCGMAQRVGHAWLVKQARAQRFDGDQPSTHVLAPRRPYQFHFLPARGQHAVQPMDFPQQFPHLWRGARVHIARRSWLVRARRSVAVEWRRRMVAKYCMRIQYCSANPRPYERAPNGPMARKGRAWRRGAQAVTGRAGTLAPPFFSARPDAPPRPPRARS